MLAEIGVAAYLAVGVFGLYKTVKIMTDPRVQRASKTVRQIWTIYEESPTYVVFGLFTAHVFLWLPISIATWLLHSREERADAKKESDEIESILKEDGK